MQGAPDSVTGTVTLEWTAADADGDELSFDIFLQRDGGNGSESLQPLMLSVSGGSAEIDTTTFGGGTARLRVAATDGTQGAFADSAEFTLTNKAPRPRIKTPSVSSTIYFGQSLNFEGEATDPQLQDGDEPNITFEWSTPGRSLGTDAKISVADLPLGDNVVTLTTANDLGMSDSMSVTVTVLDPQVLPGPRLTAGPQQIGWHVATDEVQLQSATLEIGNSGGDTLQYTAQSNAPWLSLNPTSGTAPDTLTVTANPTGIPSGVTRTAEIILTSVGGQMQTITVPVMIVSGNSFQFPIGEQNLQQQQPVIVGGTGIFAVPEDIATGTVITTIVANDPESDTLTYVLSAGNQMNRFAISNTGVVTVAAALDFETQASYTLTTSVSDGFNAAVTGSVVINVIDVQEASRKKGGGSIGILTILLGLVLWAFSAIFRRRRVGWL